MCEALLVFAAMFALDLVWVFYTRAAVVKQALLASCWASAIMLLNGMVVLGFVSNKWMLVPAILGAFAGTFAAIKIAK